MTRLLPENEGHSECSIEPRNPIPPRRMEDRRRSERRCLELPVRYMSDSQGEASGVLKDISSGGMQIIAATPPEIGSSVIVYIDRIGRFEGKVIRVEEDRFALKISASAPKLARLEAKLNNFFADEYPDAKASDRRVGPRERRVFVRSEDVHSSLTGKTSSGREFDCSVIDFSLGGLHIKTDAELQIGEELKIGTVNGVIVRKTESGYGIKRR